MNAISEKTILWIILGIVGALFLTNLFMVKKSKDNEENENIISFSLPRIAKKKADDGDEAKK